MVSAIPVIALLDIGKTNKKLFLLNQEYRVVYEHTERFSEIEDEDGDPCEDLDRLRSFVLDSLHGLRELHQLDVRAIQITSYGASLVYLDQQGEPLAPLYNYLKPYPEGLMDEFYLRYGGREAVAAETASPVLGSLNSGMQLYRFSKHQPDRFARLETALHLPQYLSWLITGKQVSDLTSIGCHTQLWSYPNQQYHVWLESEKLEDKLAPIVSSQTVYPAKNLPWDCVVGVGLHDSSSALIPYLVSNEDPFVLLSTGTWCIALNPFDSTPLTQEELRLDCLCYMDYQGRPVKASRLFAGHEHEKQVSRIAKHFGQSPEAYPALPCNEEMLRDLLRRFTLTTEQDPEKGLAVFGGRSMDEFGSGEEAYHMLMLDLTVAQYHALNRVLRNTQVSQIFVDGGFGRNEIFMTLLASAFPHHRVSAAALPQATSMGAALSIHSEWNTLPIPRQLIDLMPYTPINSLSFASS
jgi:sugar (pentulose or hexulose) kinase